MASIASYTRLPQNTTEKKLTPVRETFHTPHSIFFAESALRDPYHLILRISVHFYLQQWLQMVVRIVAIISRTLPKEKSLMALAEEVKSWEFLQVRLSEEITIAAVFLSNNKVT